MFLKIVILKACDGVCGKKKNYDDKWRWKEEMNEGYNKKSVCKFCAERS